MEHLDQQIEALIFASDDPISVKEIMASMRETFEQKFKDEEIEAAIGRLKAKYAKADFPFEILDLAGGMKFFTKAAFHPVIATHLKLTTRKKLSQAALETLSIVAYKQPVTKVDLENVRGVNCDYTVQKLLEKELVSILGRSDGPGRPLLYGTSQKFMDYFGLNDISDLPKLKDFKLPDNAIGEQAPVETDELPKKPQ